MLFGQPASLILVCPVRPRSPGSVRGRRDEGEELKCLLGKVWLKPDLHRLIRFQSGNKIFGVVLKSKSALAFPVVRRETAVQPDLSSSFPHLGVTTALITFDIPVALQSCRVGNRTSVAFPGNQYALGAKQEVANVAKMLKSRKFMRTAQNEEQLVKPVLSARAVSTFSSVLSSFWTFFFFKRNVCAHSGGCCQKLHLFFLHVSSAQK